jgi:hypothetical protein
VADLASQIEADAKAAPAALGTSDRAFEGAVRDVKEVFGRHWPIAIGGERQCVADGRELADRCPTDIGSIIRHSP